MRKNLKLFIVATVFLAGVLLCQSTTRAASCTLSIVSWSGGTGGTTTAAVGQAVPMTVTGQNCQGLTVSFDIYAIGYDSSSQRKEIYLNTVNKTFGSEATLIAQYTFTESDFKKGESNTNVEMIIKARAFDANGNEISQITTTRSLVVGENGVPNLNSNPTSNTTVGGNTNGTTIPAGQSQTYSFNITNPLVGGPNSIFDIINIVTQWIMYISVPLAVLWIMYAGFLMLTAGPKPDNFKKGRDILKYTILGLAIIFIGKGFVSLIISVIQLGGSGSSTPTTQTQNANPKVCGSDFRCGNTTNICRTDADCGGTPNDIGGPCSQASNCISGLTCKNTVCQYPNGNNIGDPCLSSGSNCAANLACDDTDGMCLKGDGSTSFCSQTINGRLMGTCVSR